MLSTYLDYCENFRETSLSFLDLHLNARLCEGVVVLDAVEDLGHAPEAVRLDVPPHLLIQIRELEAVPRHVLVHEILKKNKIKYYSQSQINIVKYSNSK